MKTQFSHNGNNHLNTSTILQEIPIFHNLGKREIKLISQMIYVRWYQQQEIIYHEDDPGIGMFIIYKGAVKLYRKSGLNGQEQISMLTQGDFFGEQSLLEDNIRLTSAMAMEETCLLCILRPDLLRLIDRKPRVGNKLMFLLAQLITSRLHQQDEEMLQVREKLANLEFIR